MKKVTIIVIASVVMIWLAMNLFPSKIKQSTPQSKWKNDEERRISRLAWEQKQIENKAKDFGEKINSPISIEIQKNCPYLGDVSELKEWKIEGNNLYLAFEPLPNDWKTITCAAAYNFWIENHGRTYTWAIRGFDLNGGILKYDWRYYGYRILGDGKDKWEYADGTSNGHKGMFDR